MFDKIEEYKAEIEEFVIESKEELEDFKRSFVGSKNKIKDLFKGIKEVANEQKKEFGQKVNELKVLAEEKFNAVKEELDGASAKAEAQEMDMSRPGFPTELGSRHPISIVQNQIIGIFNRMGYGISEGPEMEDDWHNFTALNLPPDHPARDMQDTYFIQTDPKDMVLRTHTSSVQVRVMENEKPPIRTISPGRVYRNEAISARSHCQFHQIEGLYIDKNVSFADLKQTLFFFVKELFGEKTKIRFRPSYFPFTEPSAEIDISCMFCTDGCNICKKTTWVEIGGCGMVDPAVLTNCGIDPEKYNGFAFGMGVERIAMLKYQISDIRLLTENDTRFLKQFSSVM